MQGGDANLAHVWEEILSVIRPKVSRNFYQTWLQSVRPIALRCDTMTLAVPSDFARSWLEKRAGAWLRQATQECLGRPVRIDFIVSQLTLDIGAGSQPGQGLADKPRESPAPSAPDSDPHNCGLPLNPDYTFEDFIVGESNRFAHAAAMAVATSSSTHYNPLFIYGSVGLGKTHLMQAIAHHIRRHSPQIPLLYTTADSFMHQVVNAVRRDGFGSFRALYHGLAILLFDDVQFIASKERTEAEFFHTFNALHDRKRQIVITSDRPPRELHGVEDRLISRFEWGVITDIKPPDLETRMAILAHKASLRKIQLEDAALRYIASELDSDVRALEGVILRLALVNHPHFSRISVETAAEALRYYLSHQRASAGVPGIIQAVARECGVAPEDIRGKRRTSDLAWARQLSMFLARRTLNLSFPAIGKEFGGKDHSTVIHACRKVEALEKSDTTTSRLVARLSAQLKH